MRIDNLPMDRQTAGYARKEPSGGTMFSSAALTSVFEKRDVDPEAPLFKRRYGSRRLTNASPNLLGVTADIDEGRVEVNHSFATGVEDWTIFCTLRTPLDSSDGAFPIFEFQGLHAYVYYDFNAGASTSTVYLRIYNASGTQLLTHTMGEIGANGTDYRIMVRYIDSSNTISAVSWIVPAEGGTATIGTETTATSAVSGGVLKLMGEPLGVGALASADAAGSATLTFGDTEFDDVNNGTLTLISTDTTSRVYTIKNDYGATTSLEYNAGASASVAATNLKNTIESAAGHNGKLTVVQTDATLVITQATAGTGGNTTITAGANFNNTCDVNIGATFTGGLTQGPGAYHRVVVTNFLLYDVSDFNKSSEYEALASDLTPTKSDDNAAETDYLLVWHDTFDEGGDVLSYTNNAGTAIDSYLVPTSPNNGGDTSGTDIHFGGQGVIEIPFYLDFDEYYWTPITASARLDWMFQINLTLPATLKSSTVFEFQDILKLDIFNSTGSTFVFKGTYAGTGTVQSTLSLTAGASYQVFVGRATSQTLIRVVASNGTATDTTGTSDNPAVFNYDKMMGFVIGDTADQENTAPFGGKIERMAFHNENDLKWLPLQDAVFYYDIYSLSGDQIIDRGNRALNSFGSTRISSAPPHYAQGGFKGGAYVAATGGYTMAVSTPDIDYVGELKKALKKDAAIQRRGSKAFMTSNGVNYLIDDFSKTFRPLGIPRPGTKVSCTPQGVGVIDGFVRYAYRWVTKDGTVGPAFDLDPVDAQSGVNVFLGADNFGLPGETPFGISYGECEGTKKAEGRGATATDAVETFFVKDSDGGSNHNLLRREISFPGLTLEAAVRIPGIAQIKESIFSQGVGAPVGVANWMSDEAPYTFPWIGQGTQECCFQFAFRYDSSADYQVLFGIGAKDQHYTTGWLVSNDHYKLNHLVVSIQPPLVGGNNHSLVVCRDAPSGSKKRDNDLTEFAWDYDFQDTHDYCVIVRRAGTNFASGTGEDLAVSIYNNTLDGTDNGAGGTYDGWRLWPSSTDAEKLKPNFWGPTYAGVANDQVMWGASRLEGSTANLSVKTRKRAASGSATFNFDYINGVPGGATAGPYVPGTVMYHGRMWRQDFLLQVLAIKGLDRYGARSGPLASNLEVDTAFCPDSGVDTINGGWDYPQSLRTKFYKSGGSTFDAQVVLTENVSNTPLLAYGHDMTVNAATTPDTWTTTSLDNVPLWINWTSRNEGSITVGVGSKPSVEIATKKWHTGAGIQTFGEFANAVDLKQWTWITLYFHHIKRESGTTSNIIDVWLERVFIDGNTGDWGEVFDVDIELTGVLANGAAGTGQYGLFTVGGWPGMDQEYETEIAEVRLWDGEYYTAAGGGLGANAFGTYLSNRIPPNIWGELWYYLRFMKPDVNDPDNQETMDQFGLKQNSSGIGEKGADSVVLYQQSEVKDDADDPDSTTFFVPFPDPPLSAIRGIQIFRTQVVPVTNTFPNGNTNPNAIPEAWKACRDAPLYHLSEIPRGTSSYIDTADDTALGTQLDQLTGLIPANPRGVFEWGGHLGIYVQDQPRVHFAESPTSWESFPLDMVYDLPVREHGPIEAAIELASRDARQSRVLCLGKSWGVFIDGSPTQPQANTLGGGVGASSPRCLVVEKGIAYAFNGTLWGITGDGQVEDLSLPVLDLLPDPDNARLSVSAALSSLFLIDESTGVALRFHLARRQWYVEDRNALSVTDVDGVDTWVHVSGYPSAGNTAVYQDDVESDTPEVGIAVASYNNGANTFVVSSATGLKIGQRGVLVGDAHASAAGRNPYYRQAVTIQSIDGTTITVSDDLDLTASFTELDGTTSYTLAYKFYAGVGYWGTMVDTGQFNLTGDLSHVDMGVERGDGWWAAFDSSDFAKDPTDRTGFASPESKPTNIVDVAGDGASARWGLSNRQRLERILVFSQEPTNGSGSPVGLTELELNYTSDPGVK